MEPTDKKLLDQVRDAIRLKHHSIRTEEAYTNWIKRYIYFHDIRRSDLFGGVSASYQINGSSRYLTFWQYSSYPVRLRRNSCSSLSILAASTTGRSRAGMSAQ